MFESFSKNLFSQNVFRYNACQPNSDDEAITNIIPAETLR